VAGCCEYDNESAASINRKAVLYKLRF
jgi:hypothetical protein